MILLLFQKFPSMKCDTKSVRLQINNMYTGVCDSVSDNLI